MTDTDLPTDESNLKALIDERVEKRIAEEQTKTSRRDYLASAAGIAGAGALGFLGGQSVAASPADASGTLYVEQLGDSDHPVSQLYVDQQTTLNNVEQFEVVDVLDRLDIPVYSDDSNVPNETHYFHDGVDELRYKDATGVVHSGGGESLWEEVNGTISPTTTEGAVSVDDLNFGSVHYAQSGDFVGRASFGNQSEHTYTTTSSSFDYSQQGFGRWRITWDQYFPTDTTTAVIGGIRVIPGTDETVDVRLRNVTDGETVLSRTGITPPSELVNIGPTTYTPTTTSSEINLAWDLKTDPGNNSTEIQTATFTIGVQL